MSTNITGGYDWILHLNEEELNNLVELWNANGELLPPSIEISKDLWSVTLNTVTPKLLFKNDILENGIQINIPFSDSLFSSPVISFTLNGVIEIIDSLETQDVVDEVITRSAILNFENGLFSVKVFIDQRSFNDSNANSLLTKQDLEELMEIEVTKFLRTEQKNIVLIQDMQIFPNNDDPDIISGFNVGIVGAAEETALVVGISTQRNRVGQMRNIVPSNFLTSVGLVIGNDWVLSRKIKRYLANSLDIDISEFKEPCKFEGQKELDDNVILTFLTAEIEENKIKVVGKVTKHEFGYSANGTFDFYITIKLNSHNDEILIETTEPNLVLDVSIEWWVYLVGLALGTLILAPIGGIVLMLSILIADTVADVVALGIGKDLLDERLASPEFKNLPFPYDLKGFEVNNLILDDLIVSGPPIFKKVIPIKKRVLNLDLFSGANIDVDTGELSVSRTGNSELFWNGRYIEVINRSKAAMYDSGFSTLRKSDLERLQYDKTEIRLSSNSVVFGIRTSENCFAKCLVRKQGTRVLLSFVTFEYPRATMSFTQDAYEIEKVLIDVKTGFRDRMAVQIGPNAFRKLRYDEVYKTYQKRWQYSVKVSPKSLSFPITYHWTLNGIPLRNGVTRPDELGSHSFQLNDTSLKIISVLGKSLTCDIQITAIDKYGVTLRENIPVSLIGFESVIEKVMKSNHQIELGGAHLTSGELASVRQEIINSEISIEFTEGHSFHDRIKDVSIESL